MLSPIDSFLLKSRKFLEPSAITQSKSHFVLDCCSSSASIPQYSEFTDKHLKPYISEPAVIKQLQKISKEGFSIIKPIKSNQLQVVQVRAPDRAKQFHMRQLKKLNKKVKSISKYASVKTNNLLPLIKVPSHIASSSVLNRNELKIHRSQTIHSQIKQGEETMSRLELIKIINSFKKHQV